MLITCPSCESGYEVPDHLLAGEGRRLRCKVCAEEWHAKPPQSEQEAAFEAPPEPAPPPPVMVTTPLAQPQRRRRLPWIAPASAWAASLMLVVSAAVATAHWRDSIGTAWPPSERLFHLVP